ncbi:ATP-binding cassette domain-containing protein [Ignavibacterium album]|uniref:ATP-binding cassette domain-containing protein n=1 Tax=Ignavibacterium album TaxID=591197 RepID=UPI0035B8CD76
MIINIKNLSKSFIIKAGYNKEIFHDLNLSLNFDENNFISLIAPSGFGKSTLLKIIAGFIKPDSGKIIVNENNLNKTLNNVVYIPTETVSIPWLSVKKNIEFGLSENELSESKTNFIISLIGLEGYEDHIPDKNSFGFRFRIALGRALYSDPELILLDEPFNKLDSFTKEEIFLMLKNVIKQYNSRFLLTTSGLLDAAFLSDEIILFSKDENILSEYLKVEQRYTHINEMLQSEFFNRILNKIQTKISLKL